MTRKKHLLRLGSAKRLTQASDRGSVFEPLSMVLYIPGT